MAVGPGGAACRDIQRGQIDDQRARVVNDVVSGIDHSRGRDGITADIRRGGRRRNDGRGLRERRGRISIYESAVARTQHRHAGAVGCSQVIRRHREQIYVCSIYGHLTRKRLPSRGVHRRAVQRDGLRGYVQRHQGLVAAQCLGKCHDSGAGSDVQGRLGEIGFLDVST